MLERLGAQAEASGDLTLALATYRAAVTNYTIAAILPGRTRARQARERVEELVPWGDLIDLQTGESHALRGRKSEFGKTCPPNRSRTMSSQTIHVGLFHVTTWKSAGTCRQRT